MVRNREILEQAEGPTVVMASPQRAGGSPPAVDVCGVTKRYGDIDALAGVDLQIEAGVIYALLGPNGAGKSTLVRILSTLASPDTGSVRIQGFDVVTNARQARRHLGLAGQTAALDGALTGWENLMLLGGLQGLRRAAAAARTEELLARLELVSAAHRRVRTYSGGMRRRLDIGACLLLAPSVLILDEPTTGVDPVNRHALWELVAAQAAAGTAVLLTTQYLEEADHIADRVGVIDHGCLIAEGSTADLKRRVAEDWLELVVSDAEHADAVADVVRVCAPHVDVHTSDNQVRVSTAAGVDMTLIARLANGLAGAGVDVADFSIQRPSLEDVLITLTRADRDGLATLVAAEEAP